MDAVTLAAANAVAAKRYLAPASAVADFLGRVRANTNPTNLLIIGDSTTAVTGTVDQTGVQVDSWGERFPAALAAVFPNNPVSYRWYNDTTKLYDTATVLNSGGTGSQINIWFGAVPGKDTRYPLQNYTTLLLGTSPDLILFAHGHNENNVTSGGNIATDANLRDSFVANLEMTRGFAGGVPIVLLSQNPAPAYIPGLSERRADIYRRVAAERGYGYIDVCGAFYRDGRSIANVLVMGAVQDGVGLHPSNEGARVWLAEVMKHFTVNNPAAQTLRPDPPSFHGNPRYNFLTNGRFDDTAWTGWTPTNLTISQQTGTSSLLESKPYSVKLVKTSTGSTAKWAQTITAQAKMLAGRDVTFAVRMYIPTGTPQTAAQLSIADGVNALVASNQTKVINDQWHWKIVTTKIAATTTAVTLNLQVDPSGTGSTETIYVDRASLVLGRYPADAY